MQTVLLVIHLMIIVALVGVVLLQRSEGGALGIGGGGGFMTSRGTANVLTRTTAVLAALFFLTSIGLSILPRLLGTQQSILQGVKSTTEQQQQAPVGTPIGDGQGVLKQLEGLVKQQQEKTQPADVPVAPAVEVPAAPAENTPAAPAPSGEPAPAPSGETPAAPAAP